MKNILGCILMYLKNNRYDYINTAILFGKLTAMLTYTVDKKKGDFQFFLTFKG